AFSAGAAAPRTSTATPATRIEAATSSAQLRINFVEVLLVHQHLPRLSAGGRRDEPFHLHHVDEPSGAAEADPEPPLQVRDGRLAALHDDAGGLVVEIVLFHFDRVGRRLFLGGNRLVVRRLALLAEKAREPRALLLGDIRTVEPDEARRC